MILKQSPPAPQIAASPRTPSKIPKTITPKRLQTVHQVNARENTAVHVVNYNCSPPIIHLFHRINDINIVPAHDSRRSDLPIPA